MVVLGYALAGLVGLSLGVLGSGGAIFSIPIFVYIWRFHDKQAVASGFIIMVLVGLVTLWRHYRQGNIQVKLLLCFAPTTMAGTYLGVMLSHHVGGHIQMILLSLIMVASGLSMLIFKPQNTSETHPILSPAQSLKSAVCGVLIGILVGFVGIGGGFIILPVLVYFLRLPIKQAIDNTLVIAILNASVGVLSSVGHVSIPWDSVLFFALIACIGSLIGSQIHKHMSANKLQKAFAAVLLLVATAMIVENGGDLISKPFMTHVLPLFHAWLSPLADLLS